MERMEWWELALLVAFLAILLLATVYMVVRSTRRGRRFIALPVAGKVRFTKALAKDPEIPAYAKGVLAIAVAYLALPLDLIPDFIPVIGHLDDKLFVAIAIAMILLLVPGDRFDVALAAAEAGEPRTAPRHVPPSPPPALR